MNKTLIALAALMAFGANAAIVDGTYMNQQDATQIHYPKPNLNPDFGYSQLQQLNADFAFPAGVENYKTGVTVSHDGRLFKCVTNQTIPMTNGGWCSESVTEGSDYNNYEPGVGHAWQMAWEDVTPAGGNGGDENATHDYHFAYPDAIQFYAPKVIVEKDGIAYQCRDLPNGGWCSMTNVSTSANQYVPGEGSAWQEAWIELGTAGEVLDSYPIPRKLIGG